MPSSTYHAKSISHFGYFALFGRYVAAFHAARSRRGALHALTYLKNGVYSNSSSAAEATTLQHGGRCYSITQKK